MILNRPKVRKMVFLSTSLKGTIASWNRINDEVVKLELSFRISQAFLKFFFSVISPPLWFCAKLILLSNYPSIHSLPCVRWRRVVNVCLECLVGLMQSNNKWKEQQHRLPDGPTWQLGRKWGERKKGTNQSRSEGAKTGCESELTYSGGILRILFTAQKPLSVLVFRLLLYVLKWQFFFFFFHRAATAWSWFRATV